MIETIRPAWPAPQRVNACCTTRVGGVSRAPWDSLNLALHVGDDPAAVALNRARLREQLELPGEPQWINQTHGSNTLVLEQTDARDADAAISRSAGTVAAVMVADCLPILLCDRAGTEVAAVHAGWRGLRAGVIQAALSRMQSNTAELLAWIGPGISQARFEVGEEVRAAFVEADATHAASFDANRPGHWLCDLAAIAERILRAQGVVQVVRDEHCTHSNAEYLYSYRRDGATGRMAALIWIS